MSSAGFEHTPVKLVDTARWRSYHSKEPDAAFPPSTRRWWIAASSGALTIKHIEHMLNGHQAEPSPESRQ